MSTIERNGEGELEQKLLTPASRDSGIKTDVVVACCCRYIVLVGSISGRGFKSHLGQRSIATFRILQW